MIVQLCRFLGVTKHASDLCLLTIYTAIKSTRMSSLSDMNMSQALGIRVQVKAMENFLDFISQFSDLIVMTRKILGIVRETMREIKCFIQHNID